MVETPLTSVLILSVALGSLRSGGILASTFPGTDSNKFFTSKCFSGSKGVFGGKRFNLPYFRSRFAMYCLSSLIASSNSFFCLFA